MICVYDMSSLLILYICLWSFDVSYFLGVGFEGSNVKNGNHELKMIKQKGKVARLQEEIERRFFFKKRKRLNRILLLNSLKA
jgi:hypothetical protein